jgi:hypothetical protein
LVVSTSYTIWSWPQEQRNSWMTRTNKPNDCLISRYIWNNRFVCDPGITIFVQIRLTQQWSSFSRMMLWWSECSASMTVLIQSCSNVKSVVYDEEEEFVEAASSTFRPIVYNFI